MEYRYRAVGRLEHEALSVDIERNRYLEVKNAKATCLYALELEEKLALLLDNFAEYEVELLRLAESSLIWPNRWFADFMHQRLLLDRRLVNLLTACRLYLDQSDHLVSTIFGKPSMELGAVKAFKNDLHSTRRGYRLMEAVRNHVQHAGTAIHSVTYGSSLSHDHAYVEFTIAPSARVKDFAENPKFSRKVLAELREGKEAVDLRGPLRDYVSCLISIHEQVRETIHSTISDARDLYEAAVAEFSVVDGEAVKFPQLLEVRQDGTVSEETALVGDFLVHHDRLLERNVTNKDLRHSTASNSDRD